MYSPRPVCQNCTASGPFDSLPKMYCDASDPFDPLLKLQPTASDRFDTLPAEVACSGCRRRPVEVPNEVVASVVTHFRSSEQTALLIYFSNTTIQLQYKTQLASLVHKWGILFVKS